MRRGRGVLEQTITEPRQRERKTKGRRNRRVSGKGAALWARGKNENFEKNLK